MKNSKIIFTALLGLALLATGCERDEEKPSLTIIAPNDNTTFLTGDEVHVEADFSDNEELDLIHIYIGDQAGFKHDEFVFDYLDKNIRAKTQHVHEHFIVPAGIGAQYYLHFHVRDKEGHTLGTSVRLNFGS